MGTKTTTRLAAILFIALAPCAPSYAQDVPDRRGEVWGTDTHPAGSPTAQINLSHRRQNEGGSDGAGLCVIASITNALHTQGFHSEAEALWARAKQLPGGYGPEKLERLVREVAPHLKWVSITDASTAPTERLLRSGIPVSGTMSTGRLYGYRPIHHMVNPVHLDASVAAVVDNNKPDVTAWMPRAEYDRRYVDGGTGWTWAFDYPATAAAWVYVLLGAVAGLLLHRLREAVE